MTKAGTEKRKTLPEVLKCPYCGRLLDKEEIEIICDGKIDMVKSWICWKCASEFLVVKNIGLMRKEEKDDYNN